MKQFYSYMMASRKEGALYVGMTNNLLRRIHEHKKGLVKGHSKKYRIKHLVYYNVHRTAEEAITAEKWLKSRLRREKIELIEENNPEWQDLYEELL